jgi:MFS family permease
VIWLCTLFAAFDQTAMATAAPHVARDLGGLGHYSLIMTSYMFAMTISIPIVGRLSDAMGHRIWFLIALGLFMVGSAACAGAVSYEHLILMRFVQGLGAGGLQVMAFGIFGTLVAPRIRLRYLSVLSTSAVLAALLGPLVGAVLAVEASWRWIFLINLPAGALAAIVVWFAMEPRARSMAVTVDWAGAFALAGATIAFLFLCSLLPQFGTRQAIVGLAAVSCFSLIIALTVVERRRENPILPFSLARSKTVLVALVVVLFNATAMTGVPTYLPLAAQTVEGISTLRSGFDLMPLILGAAAGSIAGGQLVARTGQYKLLMLLGTSIAATGFAILALGVGPALTALAVAFCGVGVGTIGPIATLLVQVSAPDELIGSATALVQYARALGATVGVSLMGLIASYVYVPSVANGASHGGTAQGSIRSVFFVPLALALLAAIAVATLLRESPLSRSVPTSEARTSNGTSSDASSLKL